MTPILLIWLNFTNSQHLLIIFIKERLYCNSLLTTLKSFLNWLRTSCAVSITTVEKLNLLNKQCFWCRNNRMFCSIKSYNKCCKCYLSALTQAACCSKSAQNQLCQSLYCFDGNHTQLVISQFKNFIQSQLRIE